MHGVNRSPYCGTRAPDAHLVTGLAPITRRRAPTACRTMDCGCRNIVCHKRRNKHAKVEGPGAPWQHMALP